MSGAQWYAVGDAPPPQAYLQYTDASNKTWTISFDVVISEDWPDQGTTVTEHPVEVGADVADHVRVKLATCELKVFSSNEPLYQSSGVAPQAPTPDRVSLYIPTVNISSAPQTLSFSAWNNPIELREYIGDTFRAIGGTPSGPSAGDSAQSLLAQAHAVPMAQTVDAGRNAALAVETVSVQVGTWSEPVDFVRQLHDLLLEQKDAARTFTVVGTKQSMFPMVIESLSFHRDKDTGSGEEISIGFKQVRIVTTETVPNPTPFLPGNGGKKPVNHGGQNAQPVTSQSLASMGVTYFAQGIAATLGGRSP